MKLRLWQIDAFAEKVFEGNPAAIVPLESWLDDPLMQRIANENNLAETAFFIRKSDGQYDLRWFTPESEVDLCGHATLASAWLIFEQLNPDLEQVAFATRSGTLVVECGPAGLHRMSLPSDPLAPFEAQAGLQQAIGDAFGISAPIELLKGRYLAGVWPDASDIRSIKGPGDVARLLRPLDIWGFIATAPGNDGYDFVSRFFAPDKGVPEDPVTGSAHCALTPFWAKRLSKKTLKARQLSPRGGNLVCINDGARTILSGTCALYMRAEIEV